MAEGGFMGNDEFEHDFDAGTPIADVEGSDVRRETCEQADVASDDNRTLTICGRNVSKRRAALVGVGVVLATALVCMGVWRALHRQADANIQVAAEQVKSASDGASRDDEENAGAGAVELEEKDGETGAGADASLSADDEAKPAVSAARGSDAGASRSEKVSPSKGTSGGGSGSKHAHDWVPQTTTVHHDAQYDYVYHDAETKGVIICNHCNVQFGSVDAWGTHIDAYIDEYLSTNPPFEEGTHTILIPNASYRTESVVVKPGWEEQVLVSEAWDETVTFGYVCSGCGAAK